MPRALGSTLQRARAAEVGEDQVRLHTVAGALLQADARGCGERRGVAVEKVLRLDLLRVRVRVSGQWSVVRVRVRVRVRVGVRNGLRVGV